MPPSEAEARGRFDGQVAIVTGGAWGMGRRHAERLAAEGARVVLADIQFELATAVADSLANAIAVECDVSCASDTERVAARALEAFGRIDILVNNAGGALIAPKPLDELSEEDWDKIVDVNLKGMWLCTKAVLPAMRDAGRGRIVNIGSISPMLGNPGRAAYAAAKGGVVGLTRTMARELGSFGITVNCVAPGLIEIPHPKSAYSPAEFERMKARRLEVQAVKRLGQMDDVSDAVLFFASTESDFVTGQLLPVDGGTVLH
ncbi:MAG TPA: SDR family NAD(P)-dependent oxidoreductase [Solirubrobacteraceae bacterium]|jgi:3-oxoacyl-[acyl-carrier protein] reductase